MNADTLDVERIRADFPILRREGHGRPLVYLDNAATSQKPEVVIDALVEYYTTYNANIHRGIHALAEEATARYEETRQKVADFIGAPGPECIVFTRNTTESINLVANAWGRKNLGPGDEIVLSVMEHHSNLVPWQFIARATGARLRHVDIDGEGRLLWDDVERLIGERTKLVAITQMSNVLGTINPVRQIADLAHQRGALVLVDAAQSVPHLPVDVQDLDCDFLAFSAHKMLGPTGVGVLYARRELLEAMDPFLGGGEMIRRVRLEEATWNDVPWKFEAGTPNIAGVCAFSAALGYLQELGMEQVRAHDLYLAREALRRLSQISGVTVYGPKDPEARGGVVAFNVEDIHPHDVGTVLDGHGVAIRAGHHCCQPLMGRLDVVATARASFYVYNTVEELDALVEGIEAAKRLFRAPVHTRT
ncbi:MAG: cysteine desulfurase [Chloroflexi bacterium RBG_16_68_14]|nr:MAG: cysteine desulfurase [Chloroflexi bacterium RBG_16_68_14]